jgi:pilus assembly protein CpaC
MPAQATIALPAKQGISQMFIPFLRKLTLAAAVFAIGAVGGGIVPGPARADEAAPPLGAPVSKSIKLGLNKSLVIDLPRDARDLLVSNPEIADAVIRTPRRIYLTGIKIGQANIIVFDRAGAQIVTLDLAVERDGVDLNALLRRLIPDSDINVEVLSDNIVLTGTVKNAQDSNKAENLAQAFIGGAAKADSSGANANTSGSKAPAGDTNISVVASASSGAPAASATPQVINLLTIDGEDQVYLKVTVAEVQRNIAKQLGIDLSGVGGATGFVSSVISNNPFAVQNKALSNTALTAGYFKNAANKLTGTLKALEQTGMIRTLAEPTLTAISGESASFLAGGEFPVPTGFDAATNQISVTFKQFGVALSFTPVVLSEGRISLHVKTEVSQLSDEGAVSLGSISIPSLKVRRAETTLELPSGGAMVMGGLLQDNVSQAISGFPGLKDLPVLGTLFRSRDFQRNETELVIFATPYLVKPVARTDIARPDDGFAPANDATSSFLGRLNRVYGAKGAPAPAGIYRGTYGFIFE